MSDKVTAVLILVALAAIGLYLLLEDKTFRGELKILHDRLDTFAMNGSVPPVPVADVESSA